MTLKHDESILKTLLSTLAIGVLVFAARSSLADHYHVPTGSMEPTVEVGDRILVNKAAYGFKVPFTQNYLTHLDVPLAGDVVVLDSPEDEKTLLKRVVGLPGQTITVLDGNVFVDGIKLSLIHI